MPDHADVRRLGGRNLSRAGGKGAGRCASPFGDPQCVVCAGDARDAVFSAGSVDLRADIVHVNDNLLHVTGTCLADRGTGG